MIRIAQENDFLEIAKMHNNYLRYGFLSTLGEKLLFLIYQSMVNSKYAFCIVAEENQKIIGFVSGATSIGKFYKEFLKKNFIKCSIILFPKIFNLKILKKIFETLFYPIKNIDLPEAELLSIVVEKDYQGQNVSQKLFQRLVEEFKKRDVKEFKVIVGDNLIHACKFYEKMGGVFFTKINIHKEQSSSVYLFKI